MKFLHWIILPAVVFGSSQEDPVCIDQKPGERVVFTVGETQEKIISALKDRGMDASQCIWIQRKDLPSNRKDRDQWRWNKTTKQIEVDHSIPKSRSQRLMDQFEIIRSTASNKQEKMDALLEIEKIRLTNKP